MLNICKKQNKTFAFYNDVLDNVCSAGSHRLCGTDPGLCQNTITNSSNTIKSRFSGFILAWFTHKINRTDAKMITADNSPSGQQWHQKEVGSALVCHAVPLPHRYAI